MGMDARAPTARLRQQIWDRPGSRPASERLATRAVWRRCQRGCRWPGARSGGCDGSLSARRASGEAGQKLTVQYLIRAVMANPPLHSLGYVVNTFQSEAKSAGWRHLVDTGTHRFILDFAGGDLPYFIDTPESVEVDVKVSTG